MKTRSLFSLLVIVSLFALFITGCYGEGKKAGEVVVETYRDVSDLTEGAENAIILSIERRLFSEHPNPTRVEDIGVSEYCNDGNNCDPRAAEAVIGILCLISGDCVP